MLFLTSVEATFKPEVPSLPPPYFCSSPGTLRARAGFVHQWEVGSAVVRFVSNEAALRELFHSLQLMAQTLKRRLFGDSVNAG